MMDKCYMRICAGDCGEYLDSESSFVDVINSQGDLLCHYCRDEKATTA